MVKAIRVKSYGGPEVLELQDVEIGKPGPGEALVKIAYSGLNFIDIYRRRGTYPGTLPATPGTEASGVVEAVGEGVTTVKAGDRVAYLHQTGTYTEKGLVPVEFLILLPESISLEQGAAFPLQGMTAHYLLHEFYTIKKGDTVLIHAAAGGMGQLLVQWAHHLGARVIGTVSTEEKAKAAREAGADEVILYSKQDFVAEVKRLTNGRGAQLIIDGVGKTTFAGNLQAAELRGHIVIYGAASGVADPISPNVLMARSLTVSGGNLSNYILTREELLMRAGAVLKGMEEGWLKLKIDRVFPLAKAAEAQEILENRKSMGKLLLKT